MEAVSPTSVENQSLKSQKMKPSKLLISSTIVRLEAHNFLNNRKLLESRHYVE